MTRARDQVFLTAANYYGEGKRERKLSPFVMEALDEKQLLEIINKSKEIENAGQLTLLDWAKTESIVEKPVKINQPINYLSFSQMETFNNCPLQYKYRYIQRIPGPASSALVFGDVIHRSLLAFYELAKSGEKPTEVDLVNLMYQNWSSEGYNSKSHEESFKEKGEIILKEFYKKAYDPNNLPIDLEQTFTIKVDPSFKIGGKIDRVDQTTDGKIEIIDYKTGKMPDKRKN